MHGFTSQALFCQCLLLGASLSKQGTERHSSSHHGNVLYLHFTSVDKTVCKAIGNGIVLCSMFLLLVLLPGKENALITRPVGPECLFAPGGSKLYEEFSVELCL